MGKEDKPEAGLTLKYAQKTHREPRCIIQQTAQPAERQNDRHETAAFKFRIGSPYLPGE